MGGPDEKNSTEASLGTTAAAVASTSFARLIGAARENASHDSPSETTCRRNG